MTVLDSWIPRSKEGTNVSGPSLGQSKYGLIHMKVFDILFEYSRNYQYMLERSMRCLRRDLSQLGHISLRTPAEFSWVSANGSSEFNRCMVMELMDTIGYGIRRMIDGMTGKVSETRGF